jgi:hypothetical protein
VSLEYLGYLCLYPNINLHQPPTSASFESINDDDDNTDVNIVLLINDTDIKVMDSTVVPTPPPSLLSVGGAMPLLGGGGLRC